jgi:nitrate reductase NapE component
VSRRLDKYRLVNRYGAGLDALSGDMSSVTPWLKVASGAFSGGSEQKQQQAATAAVQERIDREREDRLKAERSAATTKMVLYGILGVVAVGGIGFMAWKVAKR